MRINRYLSSHTYLSRRQADDAIAAGRVTINKKRAALGDTVSDDAVVTLDNKPINPDFIKPITILLNKPVGYVCSRDGQGSQTVYDLLPKIYHHLNIAGRLDKDSSGLVLLTSDGNLLFDLTHPSNNKQKAYEITTDRELTDDNLKSLKTGVDIGDSRPSKFEAIKKIGPKKYEITVTEGRNRQIRRSIAAVSGNVDSLKRTRLGQYSLEQLSSEILKVL